MTAGWGTERWGVDGFGGLGPSMSVVRATAISTHEVVVDFSKAPLDVTGFLPGDVRNPGSWTVTVPASGLQLDVAGVTPYEHPLRWTVRTLQRFPDSLATVRVSAAGVRDAARAISMLPVTADFPGVTEFAVSTPQQVSNSRTRGGRDLQNLPAPQVSSTGLGGTLVIKGGDYTLVSGVELARKLITRRLTATPGEFFHLPRYGVGLNVKQAIPGGGLVRLKQQIERQVLLEPDIVDVKVSLSQQHNILTCVVRATIASTGQKVDVAINSPIGQT